jgi:hypothetical protein
MSLLKIIISSIALVLLNGSLLSIPMVESTTCTQGSNDAWLASLIIYSPFTIILAVISLLGLHRAKYLKWFTLPQFLLLPYSAYIAFKYFIGVTLHGNHPCTICTGTNFNDYPFSWWVAYWAPLQFIILIICGYVVFKYWRLKFNG